MTWKPPESVRIGSGQFMNLCKPPSAAMRSAPGRNMRWYVFPRTISVPVSRTVSGASPFTVPCVPTGMKAGVSTRPCGVRISPWRAAPSVLSNRKEKGSDIFNFISEPRAFWRNANYSVHSRASGNPELILGNMCWVPALAGMSGNLSLQRRLLRIKQTGVSIGIETIASPNRMRVGPLHCLKPAECRHQHEQRRARQMKIRQHQIDGAEFIAGRDEERRFAGKGFVAT